MIKSAIFGCSGLKLHRDEKIFFSSENPWGFILFKRNIESPVQLRALTDSIRDTVGRNVPILVDQEGGRVERLTKPHWQTWIPVMDQMQKVPKELQQRAMWLRYRIIGEELKEVGIDVNCVPLGDLANKYTHPVLLNRCYGESPKVVISSAQTCASALQDAGVLSVLKHLPGHGRAQADSHLELPKIIATKKELLESDFFIFKSLCDIPLGMTAHVLYKELDGKFPVTHSKAIIKLIRKELEFKGLLMTDDLSMKALTGSFEEKVKQSINAGCDLMLHCNGNLAEMIEISKYCDCLNIERQNFSDKVLQKRVMTCSIDMKELINEYDTIIANTNI